jgi:hypothetical protein
MSTVSPVARRIRTPTWLDLRLIIGVLLVLGSVVAGVAVVSSANHSRQMWVLTHDIAAGVVLAADDVRALSVRLAGGAELYVSAGTNVSGQTVTRAIGAGELLPRSAVGDTAASTTVTIPLTADVAPKIKSGQRITVWVSTKSCPSAIVLADTAVQQVVDSQGGGFGSAGGEDVIVRLSDADAQRVIEALALKSGTIRAGVLSGPTATAATLPTLSACADTGS